MISIAGRKHWLWRAVDQDGYVLDEIVQGRRDTKAARRLLIRLIKKQGMTPKRIITDKLRSYGAAKRDIMPKVEHLSHKGLNNRAENSHLPLRKRERMMQGFRSAGGLQRFTAIFSAVRNLFVAPPRRSALAICLSPSRVRPLESCNRRNDLTPAILPRSRLTPNNVTSPLDPLRPLLVTIAGGFASEPHAESFYQAPRCILAMLPAEFLKRSFVPIA